jgi:hypothetical protein
VVTAGVKTSTPGWERRSDGSGTLDIGALGRVCLDRGGRMRGTTRDHALRMLARWEQGLAPMAVGFDGRRARGAAPELAFGLELRAEARRPRRRSVYAQERAVGAPPASRSSGAGDSNAHADSRAVCCVLRSSPHCSGRPAGCCALRSYRLRVVCVESIDCQRVLK